MCNLRLFSLLTMVFIVSALTAVAAPSPPQSAKESDHNRKGLQYYNEAFYQQLPKGKQHEADGLFNLAVAEFEAAITANPRYSDAHRNLARIYYVRKDFLRAAEAYKAVTVLEPQDIDAHVQIALSYTQIERFADAVQQLEIAKTRTDNPEVIGKLNGYIRKIKEHK